MKLLELYARVLRLLGDEAGLGWLLALANLALAGAQFCSAASSMRSPIRPGSGSTC